METDISYPEVRSWTIEDLNKLLVWAEGVGMSDIHILPRQPMWIRLHGKWIAVTKRPVMADEIFFLAEQLFRSPDGAARLKGGDELDFAHEIRVDRVTRKRFRVNASGCKDGTGAGASIVMRSIPSLPPKIEDLGLEPEILKAATPNNGLVLVTGVMGTGKSTLLASILRHIRETQPRNILTYEAPVEFDLMGIPNPCGPLAQASIPEHLTHFNRAAPNSARRAADVVLIGESRDVETLRGMIEMAEIGVAAYSTVHTRGVAETPTRIINVFPADMQNQIASTLLASLRLIIQQRLLPKIGGGRIALKEYLVFDAAIRKELFSVPVTDLIPAIQQMVETKGRTILMDAKDKYDAGLIEFDDYDAIRHEQEMSKEG
jgi:defect-in-organelle-trafficking protein DotB